jgi:hypothetical protein
MHEANKHDGESSYTWVNRKRIALCNESRDILVVVCRRPPAKSFQVHGGPIRIQCMCGVVSIVFVVILEH